MTMDRSGVFPESWVRKQEQTWLLHQIWREGFHTTGSDEFDVGLRHLPADVFFFDGPHSALDQFRGLIQYAFAWNEDGVVVIVDDYQLADARRGTRRALEVLTSEAFGWELLWESESVDPAGWRGENGIFVFQKKKGRRQ